MINRFSGALFRESENTAIKAKKKYHSITRLSESRRSGLCGRFLLSLIPEEYAGMLRIDHVPNLGPELFAPRFNIAPTQQILIVRDDEAGQSGRALSAARWGMIPPWTTSLDTIKRPIFNARSETLWEKPLFKEAARARRCVIPADGFYEWRKPSSPGKRKQQFLIRPSDSSPMFFAGIWSTWTRPVNPDAPPITSCAILTTASNEAMAPIHDRMPVILSNASALDRWLDPALTEVETLSDLFAPAPSRALSLNEIGNAGDNPKTQQGPDTDPEPESPSLFF